MAVNKEVCGWFLTMAVALAALGCESSNNSGGTSLDDMAGAMEAKKTAKAQQEKNEKEAAVRAAQQAAAPPAAEEPAPLETVTARSGEKGKSLEGGGYLSVVASTRFWAENQNTLNVVRKYLDLYRAGVGNGEYPKTHEDFMKQIIEANSVKLPELPEGWEYVYDPTDPLQLKMRNTGTGNPDAIQFWKY